MAVSCLWLVALLSMGLLFPQISRGYVELSLDDTLDDISLVKRGYCPYGNILCGDGCCDQSADYRSPLLLVPPQNVAQM